MTADEDHRGDVVARARAARLAMRRGEWVGSTTGRAPGCVQCNLVVLPDSEADDFVEYCRLNPRPCPIIDVTRPGDPQPRLAAPGADLRTDLARYAVYRDGKRCDDRREIVDLWHADSVGFLLGSSLSFDYLTAREGVPPSPEVWVLRTEVATHPAGRFHGPLAVTMRWLRREHVQIARELTGRCPKLHGAPVHVGDPSAIGADLADPIVGPPVEAIPPEVTPMFWACGVTPQLAAVSAGLELLISHAPGYGFITDIPAEEMLE